jgi:intracellular septation protein A
LIQEAPLAALPAAHPAPHVRDIVARVAVSLATAVIAPAVLFATNLVLFNLATAMIVALVWMTGAMAWRHATGRPLSGLLLLTAVIMVVKTSIAFATGNSFIYFVQPAIVDVTVATCFLGSLWSSRPLVARLAPDFYPMDSDIAARPAIRLLFRRLTLLWGLVILAKGSITLWLLVSLSTVDFVLIKGCAIISITLTAATATVIWSILVGRREGIFPTHPADVIDAFGIPLVLEG